MDIIDAMERISSSGKDEDLQVACWLRELVFRRIMMQPMIGNKPSAELFDERAEAAAQATGLGHELHNFDLIGDTSTVEGSCSTCGSSVHIDPRGSITGKAVEEFCSEAKTTLVEKVKLKLVL